MPKSPELFQSTPIPAKDGSGKLFEECLDVSSKPVTCLGKTFASDDERCAYFTEELRKHLADPDFRKIEGFPIGKDEDILALSDPQYYTACSAAGRPFRNGLCKRSYDPPRYFQKPDHAPGLKGTIFR